MIPRPGPYQSPGAKMGAAAWGFVLKIAKVLGGIGPSAKEV